MIYVIGVVPTLTKPGCLLIINVLNVILLQPHCQAAAFVHDEKDESSICIAILSRAMKKLSTAKGSYFSMDMDEIKRLVLQIIDTGKVKRFTI